MLRCQIAWYLDIDGLKLYIPLRNLVVRGCVPSVILPMEIKRQQQRAVSIAQ